MATIKTGLCTKVLYKREYNGKGYTSYIFEITVQNEEGSNTYTYWSKDDPGSQIYFKKGKTVDYILESKVLTDTRTIIKIKPATKKYIDKRAEAQNARRDAVTIITALIAADKISTDEKVCDLVLKYSKSLYQMTENIIN